MISTATYAGAGATVGPKRVPSRTADTFRNTLRIVTEVWIEARDMHRAAQKRYPFVDN